MDQGQRQANGNRCKARRGALIGGAVDNQQETAGQHDFNHDGRQSGVAARRMFAVAVRGEAAGGGVESGFTAGNNIKNRGCNNAANYLGNNIANDLFRRKAAAGPQAEGHRRVKMAAGDMAHGVGHG